MSSKDPTVKASTDVASTMESGADIKDLKLKQQEYTANEAIDREAAANPSKIPKAIFYIIPNEFAERFCYYGITPLLKNFFSNYLKKGDKEARQLTQAFNSIVYATPLFGAALADSILGKYATIIYLSMVYVLGVVLTSVFSIPVIVPLSSPISFIGPMIGLVIMAIGSGGIKPCVAALGGDQFLESQTAQLNAFYNYFYLSINIGSTFSTTITPIIAGLNIFGVSDKGDGYGVAFAICAVVMVMALTVFWLGRKHYRKVPPTGTFVPLEIMKINIYAMKKKMKVGMAGVTHYLQHAQDIASPEMLDEVRDFNYSLLLLIPAPIFWMSFNQISSTFISFYEGMNDEWFNIHGFKVAAEQTTLLNSIMIILFIPIFTQFIYPAIERKFKFPLIDRMIVGYFFAAATAIIFAVMQMWVDNHSQFLTPNEKGDAMVCNRKEHGNSCLNGAWMIIPYFFITCGEIFFSISGLNLLYQEVGKKTKASANSLFLLTSALGSTIVIILDEVGEKIGKVGFQFLNAGILAGGMIMYLIVRYIYVYREFRTPVVPVRQAPPSFDQVMKDSSAKPAYITEPADVKTKE